jgi:hypothetical protein
MQSQEPLSAAIEDLVYCYGVSAVLCEVLRTIQRNSTRATIEPNERAALNTIAKRLTEAIYGIPLWL